MRRQQEVIRLLPVCPVTGEHSHRHDYRELLAQLSANSKESTRSPTSYWLLIHERIPARSKSVAPDRKCITVNSKCPESNHTVFGRMDTLARLFGSPPPLHSYAKRDDPRLRSRRRKLKAGTATRDRSARGYVVIAASRDVHFSGAVAVINWFGAVHRYRGPALTQHCRASIHYWIGCGTAAVLAVLPIRFANAARDAGVGGRSPPCTSLGDWATSFPRPAMGKWMRRRNLHRMCADIGSQRWALGWSSIVILADISSCPI